MSQETVETGGRKPLRIGKYQVLSHIASGGMGAVYKARDVELDRVVALKILSPELAIKPQMVKRFFREARAAAKLRHENIVGIYDFGESNGTHFLALEFVDGIDLYAYISRQGKLEPDEATLILTQALYALDHAHQQNIIHRDIKPSNFLISQVGGKARVKLTDMGLARHVREDESRVTKAGTTVGTLDYMAPEQARDSGSADIRSDIYALGCTLYHMLAGNCPFPDGSLAEKILQHLERAPTEITKLNPKVPARLAAILKKMMAKKPEERFQTPAEVLSALEGKGPLEPVAPEDALKALKELADDRKRPGAAARATEVLTANVIEDDVEEPTLPTKRARPAPLRRTGQFRDEVEEPEKTLLPWWWPYLALALAIVTVGILLLMQVNTAD